MLICDMRKRISTARLSFKLKATVCIMQLIVPFQHILPRKLLQKRLTKILFSILVFGKTADLASKRPHVRDQNATPKVEDYSPSVGLLLHNWTMAFDVGPFWI